MGTVVQAKRTPLVQHRLDVGQFTFYPNIVIGEFSEGVHVTFENASFPIQIATQLYGVNQPVVYLSHRIHSYSMDPMAYKEIVELFPNLLALGIVAQNKRSRMLANLERLFLKKPIRVFSNLEEALVWAESCLKDRSAS